MTPIAILFMAVSWITVISLNIFCFYKVFTDKDEPEALELEVSFKNLI